MSAGNGLEAPGLAGKPSEGPACSGSMSTQHVNALAHLLSCPRASWASDVNVNIRAHSDAEEL